MPFHERLLLEYHALGPWEQVAVRVVLVALVGYVLLRILRARTDAALKRLPFLDDTARIFLVRIVAGLGWAVLAAAVLAAAGVDLTALVGGLAIGGFIVGFALKDTLGNLAAGIMLLVYRPFNVGDAVTMAGQTGKVLELGMALTLLQQFDGRLVTLPNGKILSEAILNHTRHPTRRAEVKVGIAYDDDIDKAVKAILEALAQMPPCLADPAPQVVVTNLADSSVELEVRAWAQRDDFGDLINGLRPLVKGAIERAGCSIPFPQRDVHLHEAPSPSS